MDASIEHKSHTKPAGSSKKVTEQKSTAFMNKRSSKNTKKPTASMSNFFTSGKVNVTKTFHKTKTENTKTTIKQAFIAAQPKATISISKCESHRDIRSYFTSALEAKNISQVTDSEHTNPKLGVDTTIQTSPSSSTIDVKSMLVSLSEATNDLCVSNESDISPPRYCTLRITPNLLSKRKEMEEMGFNLKDMVRLREEALKIRASFKRRRIHDQNLITNSSNGKRKAEEFDVSFPDTKRLKNSTISDHADPLRIKTTQISKILEVLPLPKKYEYLVTCFDAMHTVLCSGKFKDRVTYLQIQKQVEDITKLCFDLKHLAQITYLYSEAIKVYPCTILIDEKEVFTYEIKFLPTINGVGTIDKGEASFSLSQSEVRSRVRELHLRLAKIVKQTHERFMISIRCLLLLDGEGPLHPRFNVESCPDIPPLMYQDFF
ncbi:hypothetical protein G9A89_014842 [Geosiphon pyriformis]|nr:hypothetical protein G9A89_014842 [Geosiphon pyriformis]